MKGGREAITIRRMEAADVAQVVALAKGLDEAPHWPATVYRQAIGADSVPRRMALVAAGARPERIVGFALASLLPPEAELEAIAVAREGQRRGLGRRLFQALAAELKAAGARELRLEVRASNGRAREFYEAFGFARVGMRRGYYADPVEDAVLMRIELGCGETGDCVSC